MAVRKGSIRRPGPGQRDPKTGKKIPPTRGRGRPKGTKNKFTTLKQSFLDAFNDPRIGSTEGLVTWILEDPGERKKVFYGWITRMLPRTHDLQGVSPVTPTDLSGLKDEELDGALIAVVQAVTRGERRTPKKSRRKSKA